MHNVKYTLLHSSYLHVNIEFFCGVSLLFTEETDCTNRIFFPIRPVPIKKQCKEPSVTGILELSRKTVGMETKSVLTHLFLQKAERWPSALISQLQS